MHGSIISVHLDGMQSQARWWYVRSTLLLLCQRKGTNIHIMHTPEPLLQGEGQTLQTLVVLVQRTTAYWTNNANERWKISTHLTYYFCLSAGCKLQVFVCLCSPFILGRICTSLIVSVHTVCIHDRSVYICKACKLDCHSPVMVHLLNYLMHDHINR